MSAPEGPVLRRTDPGRGNRLPAVVLFVLVVAGVALGAPAGRPWRGWTGPGLALGWLAALLSVAAVLYPVRKRLLQEHPVLGRGSMLAWRRAHITVSIGAFAAALGHAGMGVVGARWTWGSTLLAAMTVLAVSGALWRRVQRVVPPQAAADVGNYSEETARARAARRSVEIDKLLAGSDEGDVRERLAALEAARDEALRVAAAIPRYRRRLRFWRVVHVPATVVFVLALPIHLLLMAEPIAEAVHPTAGFESAAECASCHAAIHEEWSTSMHSRAATSPVTIVQASQVARTTLRDAAAPDPARFCVHCHDPVGARLADGVTLPLDAPAPAGEGITCVVCHQLGRPPRLGEGGLASLPAALRGGATMFGSTGEPTGNDFHRTQPRDGEPNQLCAGCHEVHLDRNADGRIVKGEDLVLQTLVSEWEVWRADGGGAGCVDCHMPGRSHRFVGVDQPIELAPGDDPARDDRHALLRSAATLDVLGVRREGRSVVVETAVTNSGVGHDLPSGFAFARQLWLEVVVRSPDGRVLASSGLLQDGTRDLCDDSTLGEPGNPMAAFVAGCEGVDPQLVNFQQKLVDRVSTKLDASGTPVLDRLDRPVLEVAPDGRETAVQGLTAGAVARVRPVDAAVLAPLAPGERRSFTHRFSVSGPETVFVTVRLRFRSLPPYFLRALDAGRLPDEPDLLALLPNLDVVDMAASRVIEVLAPRP